MVDVSEAAGRGERLDVGLHLFAVELVALPELLGVLSTVLS